VRRQRSLRTCARLESARNMTHNTRPFDAEIAPTTRPHRANEFSVMAYRVKLFCSSRKASPITDSIACSEPARCDKIASRSRDRHQTCGTRMMLVTYCGTITCKYSRQPSAMRSRIASIAPAAAGREFRSLRERRLSCTRCYALQYAERLAPRRIDERLAERAKAAYQRESFGVARGSAAAELRAMRCCRRNIARAR
jgi:hypothetical protein